MALIEYLPEPIVFSTMNVQKLLIMLFQILNYQNIWIYIYQNKI